MAEQAEPYNLWRYYRGQKPQHRWAAEVVADPKADHGFKVLDFDHVVADSSFWAQFAAHLEVPVTYRYGGRDGKIQYSGIDVCNPGEPDYFDHAVRVFPLAVLCSPKRGA